VKGYVLSLRTGCELTCGGHPGRGTLQDTPNRQLINVMVKRTKVAVECGGGTGAVQDAV